MKNFIIAITRTCGSGATTISTMLSRDLNINMYDRNLLRLAADDQGINEAAFANADETMKNSILYKVTRKVYSGQPIPMEHPEDIPSNDQLFSFQAKVLKELAENESYICIGRAADFVLKDYSNMVSIFIYAPEEKCVEKEMKRLGITEKEAKKRVYTLDKYRREYYRYHTGKKWEDPYNYDLCLNTAELTYEQCVDFIKEYLKLKGWID